ncbi:MAG TPA: urate hydroxylase PuuD [Chitinophagaceae bacterium]|nr:urate hydroxylase PuuD [Chitinophagaceae bacterium]
MLSLILLIILSMILVMMIVITYNVRSMMHHKERTEEEQEKTSLIQSWLYTGIAGTILAIIASIYFMVKGTVYEGHLMEWLNIVVRVMHVTFGIAWIGASFYFVFLENVLNRTENVREELAGNLWAVHGGGFYYLEKYKVAPKTIPKHLHWFKYEAYFTWISGFALLFIIYYFNTSAMLIDTNVMKLTAAQAIGISIGSFIVGWIIYDQLCKSPLKNNGVVFAIIGVLFLVLFAYIYSHVFSGRAAFIHFGAMIGSIMVANVFFVIIPSQKAMVSAAKKGQLPDATMGKNALRRSIHNNYFTLPVLFVMVSNHFPGTFGNQYQWAVLAAISIGAAGIKHWLNLREQGRLSIWIMPASVILLLAVAYVTAPQPSNAKCKEVSFAEVNTIIQERCISCHSSKPTDNVYTAPPNGVKYDTPLEITAKKDLIMQRVVITKTMPQNNKTNMTPEERDAIRCWLEQGASTK